MNDVKPFWESKTFWTNIVLGAASFSPWVQAHLTPTVLTTGFALANIGLRFISNGKITLS